MANFVPYIRKQKSRRGAGSAALEERNTYAVEVEDDDEKDIVIARPVKGMATTVLKGMPTRAKANNFVSYRLKSSVEIGSSTKPRQGYEKKTYPQWYCGFTGETKIRIRMNGYGYQGTKPILFSICFRANGMSLTFYRTVELTFGQPKWCFFNFAERQTYQEAMTRCRQNPTKYRTQRMTMARIPQYMMEFFHQSEYPTPDELNGVRTGLYMDCREEKWNYGNRNRSDFDDITITNHSEYNVDLRRVTVFLNDVDILDRHYDDGRLLPAGESIHYKDRILDRRYLLAGYGVDHNNEIIRVAATHLGRNYPTDYNGQWPYDEEAGQHIHRPLAWCSEFASWAIREGTKDRDLPIKIETMKTIMQMHDFFKELGDDDDRKYWYSANNYKYNELKYLVEPGDYCCYYHEKPDGSLGHNHSMIFIRWTDGFDPDSTVNKMTTISGVSGGVKVIENYIVGTEHRDYDNRNKYIYWNKNYKHKLYNAFAKTYRNPLRNPGSLGRILGARK